MNKNDIREKRIMDIMKGYVTASSAERVIMEYITRMYIYGNDECYIDGDDIYNLSPLSVINAMHIVIDKVGNLFNYKFSYYNDATYDIIIYLNDEDWYNAK